MSTLGISVKWFIALLCLLLFIYLSLMKKAIKSSFESATKCPDLKPKNNSFNFEVP